MVDRFLLMRSILRQPEAVYDELAEYRLDPPRASAAAH